MTKVQVRFTDYFAQTIQRMREDGLLWPAWAQTEKQTS